MANTKNTNTRRKAEPKKVAPIKVEKIVDEPNNDKKEVLAIIIGILVVAALVIGSVIYFKGDDEPLTKPNDRIDDIVDPEPGIVDPADDKKDKVKKVNYVVNKECTSCTVVTLEGYTQKVNKNHSEYTEGMRNKKVLENNKVETKVYYTDTKGTYQVVVKGTLKSDKEDVEYMMEMSKSLMTDKVVRDKKLNKEQAGQLAETTGKKDLVDKGYIVVGSEDTEYATHAFVIRIEEKDQVDWSKGVTVNGTVYNETVLNKNNESLYTTQDEKGINIIVGVTEKDLGEKPKNAPIKIDVNYTTGKGEKKESKYEVDLTEVAIKFEKESDYEDETEAVTKDKLNEFVETLNGQVAQVEAAADSIVEETDTPVEETDTPVTPEEDSTPEETVA